MEPRDAPGEDGSSPPTASSPLPPPPSRRRHSMDEDLFYHQVVTATPRRPSDSPPSYESATPPSRPSPSPSPLRDKITNTATTTTRNMAAPPYDLPSAPPPGRLTERLPAYSNSIALEGVFTMKHEIENTTKRAEDRHWHTVVVGLNGTALNIYKVKKDWGWGKSKDGPSISPDNPPWVRKSKLERSYSLLYADAGIAADYKK
jgi:hypothetical protein